MNLTMSSLSVYCNQIISLSEGAKFCYLGNDCTCIGMTNLNVLCVFKNGYLDSVINISCLQIKIKQAVKMFT